MSIYLLNADRGSIDSVEPLVNAGLVEHVQCSAYTEFEAITKKLVARQAAPNYEDVVILDTLTRLADTTRGDMKLGTSLEDSLWDKRNVYFADKNYLTVYEAAGQLIMRRLRNLSSRGYRIIVLCHENERMNPVTFVKRRSPAVNDALYGSLMGSATDCFRLTTLHEAELDAEGKVKIPAGTHILQLVMDDNADCKYQVPVNIDGTFTKVPKYIVEPTMKKVFKVLGKKPSWMVVYGEPGAGKTTLACSEVLKK